MTQKIIETDPEYPDVLLFVDITEEGDIVVEIRAIGFKDNREDVIESEIVEFSCFESAKNYIKDFSIRSADTWCERKDILYQKD